MGAGRISFIKFSKIELTIEFALLPALVFIFYVSYVNLVFIFSTSSEVKNKEVELVGVGSLRHLSGTTAQRDMYFSRIPIVALPVIFFYFVCHVFQLNYRVSAEVDINHRIDCTPDLPECLESCIPQCRNRGCEMDAKVEQHKSDKKVPLCYVKPEKGYTVVHAAGGNTNTSGSLKLNRPELGNWYGSDLPNLDVNYKTIAGGEVLKVSIGTKNRYIPPVPLNETKISTKSQETLHFKYSKKPFTFTVERAEGGVKLWDTSIGSFTFADQFIQIATKLPSKNMYGFGEHVHEEIKHDFSKYTTYGMFAKDRPINEKHPKEGGWEPRWISQNYYSVHPFYMMVENEKDGKRKSHGVFIFNSNAQEVTTGPAPHLVYRTIGGQLDIFFFPGPTPEKVLQQYHQLIGKPFLPAYWALGFQLSAFGYHSAKELEETVEQQIKMNIPLDVAYADIDFMDGFKSFTIGKTDAWKDFPAVAKRIRKNKRRLILIYDPAIPVEDGYDPFKRAVDQGARFLEWPNEKGIYGLGMAQNKNNFENKKYKLLNSEAEKKKQYPMLAVAWPSHSHVVFPDFLNKETVIWWIKEFEIFREQIEHDGYWLDMNEPAAFGVNEDRPYKTNTVLPLRCPMDVHPGNCDKEDCKYEKPPYATISATQSPGNVNHPMLAGGTLCMQAVHADRKYRHYDTHSIFGWSETVATYAAHKKVLKKRGAVIARSTFPSSGKYGGHWLGDNISTWEHMRLSVIGVMEFNMFGIPYVGADVCGFFGRATEDLCIRWQQLGAFHSFYRNHNGKKTENDTIPYQDPGRPDWSRAPITTRAVNLWRYRHLPYLYTLHVNVSKNGGSVVHPLFFDFIDDSKTHNLSEQFMWGSSVMVVPVVNEDQHKSGKVEGYFPKTASWYSISAAFEEGKLLQPKSNGTRVLTAPINTPSPVFVRGGSILPRQKPEMTTVDTSENGFDLLIALENKNDKDITVKAKGELYWDDGESWFDDIMTQHDHYYCTFSAEVSKTTMELLINCQHNNKDNNNKYNVPPLVAIEFLGYKYTPKFETAKVNNQAINIKSSSSYDENKHIVRVQHKTGLVNLKDTGSWKITWDH